MPQVFSRRFDLGFRLAAVGIVAAIAGAAILWHIVVAPAVGAPVWQPVPFSHRHHVGDDGIDCRYCHRSVETSAYAGMPTTATCMTCHSQLFTDAAMLAPVRESLRSGVPLHWQRVNRLPDFVYFDHSIHIAKGVGCYSCHGEVDRMPLSWQAHDMTMRWCLDCHRHPQDSLREAASIFVMRDVAPARERARGLRSTAQLTDCSTCHR